MADQTEGEELDVPAAGSVPGRRIAPRITSLKTAIIVGTSLAIGIVVWWALAEFWLNPLLFASPQETLVAFKETLENGQLQENIGASLTRILIGYAIGCLIGIPVGLLIGSSRVGRSVMQPWVGFLRFVPPIALLPLAIVWFGIGETSKYFLIAFSTAFIVILNSAAGVYAVPKVRVWAARSLGLGQRDLFLRILMPSSVPFVVTGMRLAMGNAFMTIVAAEMISADSGLGYMIFNARQFFQTGTMFVGLITIGALGLLTDRILSLGAGIGLRRYGLHEKSEA
jgi:NitT/TauT family transport system permease protein